MPATSTFIVIGFSTGARGQLRAAQPKQFKMLDRAIWAAEKAIGRYIGAAVVEQLPDEYAEPKLVKALGRLPAGFEESLAA